MLLESGKKATQIIKNLFNKGEQIETQPKKNMLEIFRQKIPEFNVKRSELEEINLFAEQLSRPIVEYRKIQMLAWHGIPDCIRGKIWKYLLKYCFLNDAGNILTRKRQQYRKFIKNYWNIENFTEEDQKVYRNIDVDVKRIGQEYNEICKVTLIQTLLKRILFIWHMRHPQSGYVQGMCDIVIPFVINFLDEFLPVSKQPKKYVDKIDKIDESTLIEIQADAYWCMSKMMDSVLSNYTKGFNGLQQAYMQVEQKLFYVDQELYMHFKEENIDLFAFSFRNISTMLMRLFVPRVAFRLLDTYISLEEKYPEFMVYLLIAILEKSAKKMLKMKFDEIMGTIQNLPTKNWTEDDIQIVIAQAYVYMIGYEKQQKQRSEYQKKMQMQSEQEKHSQNTN